MELELQVLAVAPEAVGLWTGQYALPGDQVQQVSGATPVEGRISGLGVLPRVPVHRLLDRTLVGHLKGLPALRPTTGYRESDDG